MAERRKVETWERESQVQSLLLRREWTNWIPYFAARSATMEAALSAGCMSHLHLVSQLIYGCLTAFFFQLINMRDFLLDLMG